METRFKDFFERIRAVTGIKNQSQLAEALGLGRAAVSLAKKKDSVPPRWVLDLAERFELNPTWLDTGRGRPMIDEFNPLPLDDADPEESLAEAGFVRIPKVEARLSAGGGSFETAGQVEGYYSFRSDWVQRRGNPKKMVLMQVVGNSMEPEIHEGDMVLLDQSKTDILSGGIYAVGVEDTVMVKRIERLPGTLVLHSDNTDYAPVRLSGEELMNVRIIGKVLWAAREYY